MATRDTSVNLVIKARNEADRAINSVSSALTNLFTTTENGQQKISSLTSTLAGIDKAASTISAAADKGQAAFDALGSKIGEQRNQLASLREQASQAAAAIAKLSGADAIVDAGRDQSGRLAQLKVVTDAYDKLEAEIRKVSASLASDEGRLSGSRSALQQLGSTAIAASEGQARLRAEIELETQALREQAQAAERVTAVQARINSMTGVDRPATFDGSTASQSAEILAEAAARDALIQKYKQQAAEARQLADAEADEQANRRRFGITDDPRGGQAAQSAAVFQAAAADADKLATETAKATANERELDAAAQRLRESLRPQATLQKQFNDEIREAIALRRAEKISTEELRDRITQLRAAAARAQVDLKRNGGNGVGIFGLRPYEVTNLGYQINDLVTQVASGTSVTQALAQQGGQILQILPQIGTRLLALATNPAFLVLAAGAATLVVGLKEVGDEAERIRTFTKDLGLSVDGSAFDPQKLNASAEALERYGLSAKDAVAAVRLFVSEGIDSSSIERFGKTASDLAEILGVDVKDAAQIVADGFDGTYESVRKLDERFNFLTAAQRDYIEEQYRLGNATEATNYAFDLFAQRAGKTAEDARGPWASAFRELGNAWSEFKQGLADTAVFKAVGNAFATMAGSIARDLRMLRGAASIADLNSKINEKSDQIARLQNGGGGLIAMLPGFRQNATRQLEDDIRKLEAQRNALQAQQAAPDPQVLAQQQERTRKANEDLAEETRRNREKDSARTAEELAREKALADLRRDEFKYADQATKQAYVDQKVQEARAAALKKAADEREREARAAKTAAEQARRGYIQDIQDNGREGILSTARRFDGQNENTNNASLTDFFRSAGININPAQTAWCAAFVNAVLSSQNLPTSKGPNGQTSLAARSFLNYGQDATSNPQEGDIVVLRRGNNNSQGHVGFFQGFDENGNVKVLGGNQSNGVNTSSFSRNNVLAIRRAPSAAQVATEELKAETQKVEKQTAFNAALDVEARKRELNIASANTLRDLTGEALIDAQKSAAVEEAVRRDREKAAKDGLDYTKTQEQRTRELAAAEFEATRGVKERADARKKEATEPVDQLVNQRKSLQDQLEAAQRMGDTNLAGRLGDQIGEVNTKLEEAIDKAIRFWQALGGPESEAAIAKLQGIKQTMGDTGTQFLMTGRQINESIAGGVASAFDNFAKNVAEGKNVFKSLRDAFLQFASDFLRQIAQMIIKQAIFNAIGGATGTGGAGEGIAGFIGKLFHSGGVVGEGGGATRGGMNPAWFASATRYHTGGVVGLAPDEMPAVLRKGEEVLTRGDPRHRANGGGSGGASGPTKIVNVFDAGQAAEEILRTPAGEKAMLNFVSNNRDAFKAAIGG